MPASVETVGGWQDGRGFLSDARSGDVVSLHWDWACDLLDARRLAQLQHWTKREMAIANLTI
jgi:hypothetical protein